MSGGKRRLRLRGWWWKLPLLFVAFSVLQVLALRFVDPPFSAFMAGAPDGCGAGRRSRFPHRPRLARPAGDLAEPAAGAGGRGGPELRRSPRLRFRRHREGAGAQREDARARGEARHAGEADPRRQHHQPADRQEPVPVAGHRADPLAAQGTGSLVHGADRGAVAEAPDPRGLRQHRRVRRRRVWRAGGVAQLLPQGRVQRCPRPRRRGWRRCCRVRSATAQPGRDRTCSAARRRSSGRWARSAATGTCARWIDRIGAASAPRGVAGILRRWMGSRRNTAA